MTKEEALDKIHVSIEDGVQIITPSGKSYDQHLSEVTIVLLSHVIDPVKVVVTSACFPDHDFQKYSSSTVWAIVRKDNSWLLTLENEQEFALGFGDCPENISMHGFSSSDALCEWCG